MNALTNTVSKIRTYWRSTATVLFLFGIGLLTGWTISLPIIALIVILWWALRELHRINGERVETADALSSLQKHLEERVRHRTNELALANEALSRQNREIKARVAGHVAAEQRMAESEALLAAVIDSAKDAIIICEADKSIVVFNHAAQEMFNCPAERSIGLPLATFLTDDIEAPCQEVLTEVERDFPTPRVGIRDARQRFPVEASCSSSVVGGRTIYTVMVRDVSERIQAEELLRHTEEQLRHAQKMDALGNLAGGVAHEFNNLLQAIIGFTGYAMETLDPESRAYRDLTQTAKAAERAAALTRQLLGFSRRQMLQRVTSDPNHLVADLAKLLQPLIGTDISLKTVLSNQAPLVQVDPGQFQQILMNLCLNARDAMADGGELLIRTENTLVEQSPSALHRDVPPGRYLVLSVTDTGCGMSDEVRQRIFEPFFTTKQVGHGTGLGLSMVYGMVQQHDAYIHVYSERKCGTTFRIYFPGVSGTLDPQPLLPESSDTTGSERILIAEDDPLVREVLQRKLTAAGYEVTLACDGAAAVQIFQDECESISLVLLDIAMPRLNGHEALERIRQLVPEIPAILCTAYDPAMTNVDVSDDHRVRLLQKPINPELLLKAIRESLDYARPSMLNC